MTWTSLAVGHLTDAELQAMTKEQLAAHLTERTGAAPRGAPSKPELIRLIQRLYTGWVLPGVFPRAVGDTSESYRGTT